MRAATVAVLCVVLASSWACAARRQLRPPDGGGPPSTERTEPVAPAVIAGCEFPDCYPAEAMPGELGWRINLEGPPGTVADLGFERPYAALENVRLEGAIEWVPGTPRQTLRVSVGKSVVTGIKNSRESILVAVPRISPMAGGQAPVSLTIEQLAWGTIVGGYSFAPYAAAPADPPGCTDQVRLKNKGDGHPALLTLVDLSSGASKTPSPVLQPVGSAGGDVGNLADSLDTVVFSDSNGVAQKNFHWTSECPEKLKVYLPKPQKVPVTVWIVRGGQPGAVKPEAEDHLAFAEALFNHAGIGVSFRKDAVFKSTTASVTPSSCSDLELKKLWDKDYYQAGSLNVYYVGPQLGSPGCTEQMVPVAAKKSQNSVLIYLNAEIDTLAHELAHTMRLSVDDRTEEENETDLNNLMSRGIPGATRTHLTLGQVYRTNVLPDSALNRFGAKPTFWRDCYGDSPAPCLPLEFDGQRPWKTKMPILSGKTGVPLDAAGVPLLEFLSRDDWTTRGLDALGRSPGARLVRALRALLLDGPSRVEVERHRRETRRALALIGMASDRLDASAARYEDRFVTRVRIRAAVALARIGWPEGQAALSEALKSDALAPLRQQIEAAIQQ